MIIRSPREVHSNLLAYSLDRIRAYKNSEYVFKRLIEVHEIPMKWHKPARDVAQQIRACIINAQEHFSAAAAVSHTTRSLHLYYGLMNYALAVSIYKGGGDYRMDKIREKHASHGLTPTVANNCDPRLGFSELIKGMRAKPKYRKAPSGEGLVPYGTFEVWRSQHREFPGSTRLKTTSSTGGWYTVQCVGRFIGKDAPPKLLPTSGIGLDQALLSIPALTTRLARMNIATDLVGASLIMYQRQEREGNLHVALQPRQYFEDKMADFRRLVKIDEEAAKYIEIKESPFGACSYDIRTGKDAEIRGKIDLPPIVYSTSLISYFSTSDWDLGEFGAYYITLFLLGNIVRYYPDIWVPHVEADTEFAQIIEIVCDTAIERISVLSASELDREQIVAFEYDPGLA